MKLQQLRCIVEVARHDLNVTAAASALFTSQPGVSKQIRLLEEELGVELFERAGRQLVRVTEAGRTILQMAERMLLEADNIRQAAAEFRDETRGSLSIATTHTQVRYALPPVVRAFRERYPSLTLHMHQGTPPQISELAATGVADLAIATEALELYENLVLMPCYRWNRCVVVPHGHPLATEPALTLETLARYPLVTYVFGFTGRSQLDAAFAEQGLKPNVVFTATDAEAIKTYVRMGVGVGIVARMAFDPERDRDLVALDVGHLFAAGITSIGFRRGMYLRGYVYEFIRLFAPHLPRPVVDAVYRAQSRQAQERLFRALLQDLPVR